MAPSEVVEATRFRFNNNIQYVNLADYHKTLERYIDGVKNRAGVISIYQMGNVHFPGISDLDLIIVVDERLVEGTDFMEFITLHCGPMGRYIFSHPVYVIDRYGFQRISALFYADNLQHLWGEHISRIAFDPEQREFYKYQIAVQSAIGQSFTFLRCLHNHSIFNFRSYLCHLNAIRHNFGTLMPWVDYRSNATWHQYEQNINSLRAEWFELEDTQRAIQTVTLTNDGLNILIEILNMLYEIGINKQYIKPIDAKIYFSLLDICVLLRLTNKPDVSIAVLNNPVRRLAGTLGIMAFSLNHRRLNELLLNVSLLDLPAAFHPMLAFCSQDDRTMSKSINRRMICSESAEKNICTEKTRPWLIAKEQYLNEYLDFIGRKKISGFLMLTSAPWLSLRFSMANRLKTIWTQYWVGWTIK